MTVSDCLFCKIIRKEIPSNFLYETDQVIVIRDINPKAKVHILVIPKQHVVTFNDITTATSSVMADLGLAIAQVTKNLGIADSGYKVVANNGRDGGQLVPHLHLHVLGGESVRGVT